VKEHADHLRRLPYAQLLDMDGTKTIQLDARAGTISTIAETMGDGRLKIIVQGFLEAGFLSVKHVALEGFLKSSDESIVELCHEEFYGYD
jgi:hypothetical protein